MVERHAAAPARATPHPARRVDLEAGRVVRGVGVGLDDVPAGALQPPVRRRAAGRREVAAAAVVRSAAARRRMLRPPPRSAAGAARGGRDDVRLLVAGEEHGRGVGRRGRRAAGVEEALGHWGSQGEGQANATPSVQMRRGLVWRVYIGKRVRN
jgi:hypothetical protein